MAKKAPREKKPSHSFFISAVNMFTLFLYSFFAKCRIVKKGFSGDSYYKDSITANIFEKNARSLTGEGSRYAEWFLEKSVSMRAAGFIRIFLSSLSLNVYGIFTVVYGLVSVVMYYLAYVVDGKNSHGTSALVTAVIMIICAVPMLVASRPAVEVLAKSVIMRKILLSFLGLPEEKLKCGKPVGGTEYMFMSAIIALLLGILTYFVHPAYVLMVFGVIILISLISSHPEAGVVITIAATPFLQFSSAADLILTVLIIATMVSYVGKLIRRRRTVIFSAEVVLIFLFCCFILVSCIFSAGGLKTVQESFMTAIVILGGFFTTYSLMETPKRLSACLRIMMASFLMLCFAGLWNLFYNGIADGVIYSLRESVRPIFENNIIYLADCASVFGVYAVLMAPLVFGYIAKRRSMKGVALGIVFLALTVYATFVYGTYETLIAILIEFCVFWILYSHKSLTVVVFAAIPAIVVILSYPYFAMRFDLPRIGEVVHNLLPLPFSDASAYPAIVESTLRMLQDGHLSGIGVGSYAFEAVYPPYADAISAGAENPGSLWLQVICWAGIGGAATFVIFVLVLCKNALGHLANVKERAARAESLALFCGVFIALIFGCVNCIWDDIRMLYLFFACAGILAAYVREGKEAEIQKQAVYENNACSTDIELNF